MKIRLFTLPNLLTLANLLCGSLAVISMISLGSHEALKVAFWLMAASAVFDFLDGLAARLTKSYSPLGVQLDSLADMVSFGLLPTIIALKLYYLTGGTGLWGAFTLLIVLLSALRLAKFNIDDSQKSEFIGLPTPACALLIAAVGYAFATYNISFPSYAPWIVVICSAILAFLLISPVRMFSLKFAGFGLKDNATRYTFLLASLVFIIILGIPGVAAAIILYILTSIIMWLVCRKPARTKN